MKNMTVEEYLNSIRTPEEKTYERYAEVIGGEPEPIGLEEPSGYPAGVEERGGVVAAAVPHTGSVQQPYGKQKRF